MEEVAQGVSDASAGTHAVDHRISAIETFLVVDRFGAVGGLLLAAVANALFWRDPSLWFTAAAIGVLVLCLTIARGELRRGRTLRALALASAGNWLVPFFVAFAVPQLWPVMVITVLMPVVLATPFVRARALLGVLAATAVMVAGVAAVGLLRDDGGVLPDLEDELELLLVTGALIAQIVPVSLIVWNNSRLAQLNLSELASLNNELLGSQEELANSRRRVVEATDVERRRIERDLHDGAQQELVALGIRLRLLEELTEDDATIHDHVTSLVAGVDDAVQELRRLAHGIYPPLLETQGLGAALQASARRSGLDVRTDVTEFERPAATIERALYFVASEALTNVAKHASSASVEISLRQNGGAVVLSVTDDGPGFVIDGDVVHHGTYNMGDRLAAVGGTLRIASAPGEGTTVTATAPAE